MAAVAQTSDGRHVRGEKSRQAIIAAAIRCIARDGLGKTTIGTVSEEAGVSRALINFHFKSKSKLHEDVLNFLGAEYSPEWDSILADDSLSSRDRLMRLIEHDVSFAVQHPRYIAVWFAFWGEGQGNDLYRRTSFPRDERHKEDVKGELLKIAEEGGYKGVDVVALDTGIWAMLFGLWLDAHVNPRETFRSEALRAIHTFLSGFFPREFPQADSLPPST